MAPSKSKRRASTARTIELWRVFPWDPSARRGARFSPTFVPLPTGRGRFDLPADLSPTLYLAESPEHAVAEVIQAWRGRSISQTHLRRFSRPLALTQITLDTAELGWVDLCEPQVLLDVETRPDRTASRLREVTQPLARRAWDQGHAGLRWWSSFWGDWHTHVVFTARAETELSHDEPVQLDLEHEAVVSAAELLGIEGVG